MVSRVKWVIIVSFSFSVCFNVCCCWGKWEVSRVMKMMLLILSISFSSVRFSMFIRVLGVFRVDRKLNIGFVV